MSEFPLYDILLKHPEPLTRMQDYLRDEGRTWEEIEARRKAELKQHLLDWKNGKHALLVLIGALDTITREHPLAHLPRIAKDQTSFDHHLNREKKLEPEEFQRQRKAHIEGLVKRDLHPRFYQTYALDAEQKAWIDRRLVSIDNIRSLDVVSSMVNYLMQPRLDQSFFGYKSEYGMAAVLSLLQTLRTNEDIDNLVHPNDAHLATDIFDTLLTHKWRRSYSEHATRDEYQRPEDIELRRASEIVTILQEWKAGAHPFLVMSDILDVVLNTYRNHLSKIIRDAQKTAKSERSYRKEKIGTSDEEEHLRENSLVHTLREKISIRRAAKQIMRAMQTEAVAYRGSETHPEFAALIDKFIAHTMEENIRSFDIIYSIASFVFEPLNKEPQKRQNFDNSMFGDAVHNKSILGCIRRLLDEEQTKEDKEFEANRPMGPLHTQTEDEAKEPLSGIFQRIAKAKSRKGHIPVSKLTDQIIIVASGSGMIKPFPRHEYDDTTEEHLYGTTTARITTYSVSFVPKDPGQRDKLVRYVSRALERIANIEPAFEIPFDYHSTPYERPTRERYSFRGRKYKNTDVQITNEGHVQPVTRLDLDDLWHLYYLLEDIIEPSEQIAAAMNAARYAEERGVLMQMSGLDTEYSNTNMRPESQMGSLDNENPADYVAAMMRDTLSLYALDEINEEQLLQRVLVLSDHTLTGAMVDPHGLLPTFNRLTDQSNQAGAIITYDAALKERARDIMMIMTGTQDKDRPLFPALIKKIAEISSPLRDQLRAVAKERHERFFNEVDFGTRSLRTKGSNRFEDIKEFMKQEKAFWDELDKKDKSENTQALAARANIALCQSEVGATTDRSWRGTNYVSRSRNSLWVRKEIPSALKPFLRGYQRPDIKSFLSLTHEGS